MRDKRLYQLLTANIVSSIGSGVTMIGVPWLLINRSGGEEIFGYASLCMTLLLFFASLYIGVWVDRVSRKKVLLHSQMFGFLIIAFFSGLGFTLKNFTIGELVAIYVSSSIYYAVFFPTQFAFIQELFDRSQYKSLNSMMEIQNQAASMVAGGFASFFIEKMDLSYILAFDALTYLIGFLLIQQIPYTPLENNMAKNSQIWTNLKDGFLYLKEKPLFCIFFVCSMMPFIGVMIGNYLYPIYIAKMLKASASVMGYTDMCYAVGAILAGITIPVFITKTSSYKAVVVTAATYTAGTLLIAWFPIVSLFLLIQICLGWGNAGARVARNTIMMETVPNQLIGRVNSFFSAIGMFIRVCLLGLFSKTVAYTGASISLSITGGLLLAAFIGIILSRKIFVEQSSSLKLQNTIIE